MNSNSPDAQTEACLVNNLDEHHKLLLLVDGPTLSFQNSSATLVNRFMSAAVRKIYHIVLRKLPLARGALVA